jgi:hypothetical protein
VSGPKPGSFGGCFRPISSPWFRCPPPVLPKRQHVAPNCIGSTLVLNDGVHSTVDHWVCCMIGSRCNAEGMGRGTMTLQRKMNIDLHGYHPSQINVATLLQQAWEAGAESVTLIHGHGHNRGLSVGFVNTNTGYFGLEIRRSIRGNAELRQWVKISTLDCRHDGSTTIKLKKNPTPTRTEIELPERQPPPWVSRGRDRW